MGKCPNSVIPFCNTEQYFAMQCFTITLHSVQYYADLDFVILGSCVICDLGVKILYAIMNLLLSVIKFIRLNFIKIFNFASTFKGFMNRVIAIVYLITFRRYCTLVDQYF